MVQILLGLARALAFAGRLPQEGPPRRRCCGPPQERSRRAAPPHPRSLSHRPYLRGVAGRPSPASGAVAKAVDILANVAIGVLFFLQGARLARETVITGITHWRLHLLVLATTFVLFPIIGMALHASRADPPHRDALDRHDLPVRPALHGSIVHRPHLHRQGKCAGGDLLGDGSNIFGIFITPVLVGFLLSARGEGGVDLAQVGKIVLQLLLPFIAGQLLRPQIGAWVARQKPSSP